MMHTHTHMMHTHTHGAHTHTHTHTHTKTNTLTHTCIHKQANTEQKSNTTINPPKTGTRLFTFVQFALSRFRLRPAVCFGRTREVLFVQPATVERLFRLQCTTATTASSAPTKPLFKDIGRAEQSLLAVKIYHQLRSEGLYTCGLDIHSQADHGLILDKYASSDHAFYATKELVGEIRSHMTLMLKACGNLVDAANDTCDFALMGSARASVLVFVQCSLGYFLFNLLSRRYCESFAAVKAVMKNDKQVFKTAVNVHRTPAGKILF